MAQQYWYNEASQKFLENEYLLPGQSLDQRLNIICDEFRKYESDATVAKFADYVDWGWYSLSTPIWTNFGTKRGLGISCYGSNCEDSIDSILEMDAEIGKMTKMGGGTSFFLGHVRPRGSKVTDNGISYGTVHFSELIDTKIRIISQGSTRRGNAAFWLPIEHGDIEEFLTIRSEGSKVKDLLTGVTVTDAWLNAMVEGDKDKRRIWAKVLQSRMEHGIPYIFFTDTVNRNTVDCYKGRFPIEHSNLCSEILLPTNKDWSFVCDLMSMNVLHYDQWKHTDAVAVAVRFLNAIMDDFIKKTDGMRYMNRARNFAITNRALGLGQLGWHSYLQSKMIPMESMEAKRLNYEIARTINESAWEESRRLAERDGEPEVCRGFGRRNATLTAIAPTKSSSFILCQVSEGIEPIQDNYHVKDLAKGKFSWRNPKLKEILATHNQDIEETWQSIIKKSGSVSHLPFLSQHEKDVFKTVWEISPMELVQQAAQRQQFVDQGQSLNLYIHPKTPVKDINAVILEGWRLGVKTFYYQKGLNMAQEFSRKITDCVSCEA